MPTTGLTADNASPKSHAHSLTAGDRNDSSVNTNDDIDIG